MGVMVYKYSWGGKRKEKEIKKGSRKKEGEEKGSQMLQVEEGVGTSGRRNVESWQCIFRKILNI